MTQVTSSTKPQLKAMILEALAARYTAQSCKDKIETGNHYQSIKLGETQTEGFRSDRAEFLDQLNFTGLTVLDLGSNLGELSRAARARGAVQVDGYEYDPYFLEMARLINSYNETTRVCFYQRDITDPKIFSQTYDMVLAFSVFTYIGGLLETLARITRVLVVETHSLQGNLEEGYLRHIRPHFPFCQELGQSDWGGALDKTVKRAVLVCARTAADLTRVLRQPVGGKLAAGKGLLEIDVDVERTNLQQRFFSFFGYDSTERILATAGGMGIDQQTMAETFDLKAGRYGGWTYWLLYLKGYLQFRETGVLGRGNVYCDYLRFIYDSKQGDPGLSELVDPLTALQRVAGRYRDMDVIQRIAAGSKTETVLPILLTMTELPPTVLPLEVYEAGVVQPKRVASLDGWHRMFGARLFGLKTMRAVVTEVTCGNVEAPPTAVPPTVVTEARLRRWLSWRMFGRSLASSRIRELVVPQSSPSPTPPLMAKLLLCIPMGAKVLVASGGEDKYLALSEVTAEHFPGDAQGGYTGMPADAEAAIAALEAGRSRGATHLLVPAEQGRYFVAYPEFRRYLESRYVTVSANSEGVVYYLMPRLG